MATLAYTPATSMGGFLALCKEAPEGLIRSRDDWRRFVEAAGEEGDHPLHGVDAGHIARFERELIFGAMGLGGANWEVLADVLTYRKYVALWARFGMDIRLLENEKSYRCSGRGTMSYSLSDICTGNCYTADENQFSRARRE